MLVDGSATAYRLYDVGYEIELDRVAALLGADTRGRSRPERAEAQAFQIRNPPLSASLGARDVMIAGRSHRATLSAHVFDFGVCSLRLTVRWPQCSWSDYTAFGYALDASADLAKLFES